MHVSFTNKAMPDCAITKSYSRSRKTPILKTTYVSQQYRNTVSHQILDCALYFCTDY